MMENTRIVIISPDQTPVMVTVVVQFTDGSMGFLLPEMDNILFRIFKEKSPQDSENKFKIFI